MNCFEARRKLLADPLPRAADLEAHLADCTACTRLAADVAVLDRGVASAAAVTVPEALVHRVLAGRRRAPGWQYAAAAAIAVSTALVAFSSAGITELPFGTETVEAIGPAHPAIAAISEVAEDAARPLVSEAQAAQNLEAVMNRLGLALKPGEATAYYVGKCHVAAGSCEHIVLSTPDAQANVMLVPDAPVGGRMVVADRRLIALVTPARAGGYIVVADTPKKARRVEKLLVKTS